MEPKFREKIKKKNSEFYITKAQINFYGSDVAGMVSISQNSEDFLAFYDWCKIYNAVYDASEKDNSQGYLFWDEKELGVSMHIVAKSNLYKKLRKAKLI